MLPELLSKLESIVSAIRDAGADSLEIRALLYAGVSATVDIRNVEIVRIASLGCDLIVTFYPETPEMKLSLTKQWSEADCLSRMLLTQPPRQATG
jgi:hypothetical protein